MESFNFVILGDTSIANELGKKGTSSDITIFDRKTNDRISSYCTANTYPEKIQPLLQCISMSDYIILNVSKLDSLLGEQIIAIDIFKRTKGFILYGYEVDFEKLKNIIKKTNLSTYQIAENIDQLKKYLSDLTLSDEAGNIPHLSSSRSDADGSKISDKNSIDNNDDGDNLENHINKLERPQLKESDVHIAIDHAFDVKGVGTVILGTIKHGKINVYDELKLYPGNKTVLIKSIQMHDDPVDSAAKPARVGLAIKGVSAKDVSRGDVITSEGIARIVDSHFQINYIKNPYFKDEIVETQNYMINVGLQIRSVKIKKMDKESLRISVEKPFAYVKGDICVLFTPDSKNMRIMGYGIIKEE